MLTSKLFELPPGAAGGILAGSQTMSAAIGTAEMAVEQGAYKLPAGTTAEQVTGMIALGYGVTYIWGTVGIILICKYLPRWWGVDAKAAAKEYEEEHGVANVDDAGAHRLPRRRPARLPAREPGDGRQDASRSSAQATRSTSIVNVVRGDETLGAAPDLVLQQGDVIALGGRLEDLTANLGLIGPEVADAKVLNIPLDQAEILVTNKDVRRQAAQGLRATKTSPASSQVSRIERAGEPIPFGADTAAQALRRAVRRPA